MQSHKYGKIFQSLIFARPFWKSKSLPSNIYDTTGRDLSKKHDFLMLYCAKNKPVHHSVVYLSIILEVCKFGASLVAEVREGSFKQERQTLLHCRHEARWIIITNKDTLHLISLQNSAVLRKMYWLFRPSSHLFEFLHQTSLMIYANFVINR